MSLASFGRCLCGLIMLAATTGVGIAEMAGEGGAAARFAGADLSHGRQVFNRCLPCHTVAANAPHGVGPNLHGVFGRKAGSRVDYVYSPALQQTEVVWSPETLEQWLLRPTAFLPGARMVFAGIPDEQERTDLLAFLLEETRDIPSP